MSTMSISVNNINTQQPTLATNKKKFTDNFQTKLKNSADMSDCISVPRTIFKGYLGIMFGTTLASLASLAKNKEIKTTLTIGATLLSSYGTWAFARPYILKDSVPTVDLQKQKSDYNSAGK